MYDLDMVKNDPNTFTEILFTLPLLSISCIKRNENEHLIEAVDEATVKLFPSQYFYSCFNDCLES